MDAYLAVASKRDERRYAERPIPDDVARRILEAGRVAGSSRNRQLRTFVVVGDSARIERLAETVHAPDNVLGAALVVAIAVRPVGPAEFDAGRAAQNMMVAAWNEGIATCPTSVHDQPCIIERLGLPRDGEDSVTGRKGWRVVVIIALGYPEPSVPMSMGRARLPAEDYVMWEKWGGDKVRSKR